MTCPRSGRSSRKSDQDSPLFRYRGFDIRLEHRPGGWCVATLHDAAHPSDRPEMICEPTAREAAAMAVRWIDGVWVEEARRAADAPPPSLPHARRQ